MGKKFLASGRLTPARCHYYRTDPLGFSCPPALPCVEVGIEYGAVSVYQTRVMKTSGRICMGEVTPGNHASVWLASAWALILAIGLSYYLRRSLRRGVVTFPARFPSDYSRDLNPGMFWLAICIYVVVDAFAIGCLLLRAYLSWKSSR
jgi:hypothetical protein